MKITELYTDVISENLDYEYKAELNPEKPMKWAKTIVGYANGKGGVMFVGVSNDGEAFGIDLEEIDRTKNLVARINDRNIFPHARVRYSMRSVDDRAERFVLGIHVLQADSILRYREGDYNEKVFTKGDGNALPATPEEIIALAKRKYGVDNETTDIKYNEKEWTEYIDLCKEYRDDSQEPSLKELQNEEVVSKDEYVKSGLIMFRDGYEGEDSLICCRLWTGKKKIGTVLDSDRFKGSLAIVFRNTLKFIERNTKTGWRKTENGGREEVRSYPRDAIREALVNAMAHRDYSIVGTQIDVDIYCDRIEIVSPGSWLLPKGYEEYPLGSIPSIRRNSIISACFDVANLMERGGTGFQTIIDSYKDCDETMQPVVSIYPGFLTLCLRDKLYDDNEYEKDMMNMSNSEKIIELLRTGGPQPVRELQNATNYKSRSQFLTEIVNPLLASGTVIRVGNVKSPKSVIKLTEQGKNDL
ncbi:MAG: putative DNA binding domain-containing protein [Lachnospiraceae bacterium]|nr:putative DNA binding domain-containing protein [Lachnospiraceae bacterium]